MKNLYLIIAICMLMTCKNSFAQTWDEWFHQNWTQGEYDKQQMAGLWLFLEKVSDGLEIVGKGLNTVSNISNGEFNLHRDFFGTFTNVNPLISNSAKVVDIFVFEYRIIWDMDRVYNFCRTNPNFSADEIRYIEKVHRNLIIMTYESGSELLAILRNDDHKMTDDERMKRMDKVYDDMQDQRVFVNVFGNDAHMIAWERQREQDAISQMKSQFEINN